MQRDEFIEDIEEQWRGGIWEDKVNRELGAAITGMIAAIALLLRNGIDPVVAPPRETSSDTNVYDPTATTFPPTRPTTPRPGVSGG